MGYMQNVKTQRPARNAVAMLFGEAASLPCVLDEQVQIARLLTAYDRWLVGPFLCHNMPMALKIVLPGPFVGQSVGLCPAAHSMCHHCASTEHMINHLQANILCTAQLLHHLTLYNPLLWT